MASILLQSGASISLEDSKSRTPVDLLCGPVLQVVGNENGTGIQFTVLFFCILVLFFPSNFCCCKFHVIVSGLI